jgi:ABC-2 type transport system permease protein
MTRSALRLPRWHLRLRMVWTAFYLYLKQISVDAFVIFTVIVQPLIVALLAIYMLRDTRGFQAIYVVVGSVMTGLWSGTLFFSSFNIEFERWTGNLENIVGSPTHLATVIIGKTLANTTMSITSMLFSYPLAALFFGFRLTIAHPFLFAVSLLLTLLALISFGLVIAPIMSINPGATVWANALEFPMYIVGGFLFPILLLPAWTTPISYALSPYWAARALHATSSGGAPLSDVFLSWGLLIGFSVVYWFISAWLFRVLLRRAREEATLGLQ